MIFRVRLKMINEIIDNRESSEDIKYETLCRSSLIFLFVRELARSLQ